MDASIVAGMNRRNFLSSMVAAPLVTAPAVLLGQRGQAAPAAAAAPQTPAVARTKIKQSVMSSVWGQSTARTTEERCKVLARLGFKAMDLPSEADIPILQANGLAPAMMTGTGSSFQVGLIRKEEHSRMEAEIHKG